MATSCGKKARKRAGNRYAIKRSTKRNRHAKIFINNKMNPEEYSRMKLSDRKRLSK